MKLRIAWVGVELRYVETSFFGKGRERNSLLMNGIIGISE